MKVILTENITSLGQIGEIVNVAPGYARNYLLPKGLALQATGKNLTELQHKQEMLGRKREKVRQEMLSVVEKLNQTRIVFRRKVVEDDKLYGSVSSVDIHGALQEKGFELSRKSVQLDQPLKNLGEFSVSVRVDAQLTAQVKVVIEKEE